MGFAGNFSAMVKEFWASDKVWQSYSDNAEARLLKQGGSYAKQNSKHLHSTQSAWKTNKIAEVGKWNHWLHAAMQLFLTEQCSAQAMQIFNKTRKKRYHRGTIYSTEICGERQPGNKRTPTRQRTASTRLPDHNIMNISTTTHTTKHPDHTHNKASSCSLL